MASKVPNCCFNLKTGCNVLAALIFLCGVGGLTAGIEIAPNSGGPSFIYSGLFWSGLFWTVSPVLLMIGVK